MLRRALLAAAASDQIRGLVTATPATRAVVNRFVAGDSIGDAVRVARSLREAGLLVTLDYLGEDTTDALRATATATQYIQLLGKLAAEGLTEGGAVEVSVKPTAVGLLLGAAENGGAVSVLVSAGPWEEDVTLPDLRGRDLVSALNLLKELQLEARVTFERAAAREGHVSAQTPAPGSTLKVGGQVQLVVGE